jgi:hypothetical protein
MEKTDVLEDIIDAGSKKAREVAVETMIKAREAIGLDSLK